MEIQFQNLNAADLCGPTLADFLVNIEADLKISDYGEVLYSEEAFPVAELARELVRWKESDAVPSTDFRFSSLSFEGPGAILISRGETGWTVGSIFSSDRTSRSISWIELVVEIDKFVERVVKGLESLGIDPKFVLYSN